MPRAPDQPTTASKLPPPPAPVARDANPWPMPQRQGETRVRAERPRIAKYPLPAAAGSHTLVASRPLALRADRRLPGHPRQRCVRRARGTGPRRPAGRDRPADRARRCRRQRLAERTAAQQPLVGDPRRRRGRSMTSRPASQPIAEWHDVDERAFREEIVHSVSPCGASRAGRGLAGGAGGPARRTQTSVVTWPRWTTAVPSMRS